MNAIYRWNVLDGIKAGKEIKAVVKRDNVYQVIDARSMTLEEWVDDESTIFFKEEEDDE